MLAACGAPEAGPSPSPPGPTPTVTVPIEMPTVVSLVGALDGQTLAVLDSQIAAFEAANPDVRIEVVDARRDATRRRQEFAGHLGQGDTSLDIYLVDSAWLAEFSANDWLLPLDGYLQAQALARDDFLPPALEANTVGNHLLALPWTLDAGLLYYRQDLIDEPPRTWPDLAATAARVVGPEGTPYGFAWQGAAYESLTCNTLEFVWAYGGQVLDSAGAAAFDSPETRAALQQMADLALGGLAPPDVATYEETATLAAFAEGETAMMRNWFYAWDRLDAPGAALAGRVAIAPLPASCLGGLSLALSASSLHPDQAFRFMAFLMGHDQQIELGRKGGQPPARVTAYGDQALLAERPALRPFHEAVTGAQPRPQSPAYAAISEAIYTQVNALLRGEQDAATAASTVQAEIEAALAQP